ncbi:MAG: Multidrug resistance protein Stp [Chlamydiia bacterium]|nr:Multidrug resistance protein Stp [Chlamydiia bacterium]
MTFRFSSDKWLLLAAMICGISMIFLDSTILPVTLPTIQKELGISQTGLQWIVNVYFLAEASFVIFGGKLGDIFGIRRMFIIGMLIFGVASVFGGFATNLAWLIISRTIQGLAAALIAPMVTSIIIAKFPSNQRGKAVGMTVATGGLFLALGPFIGGLFTEYATWRWVFFINIFISLIGVVLTMRYVPKYPSRRVKIDFVSLFLFVGALFLITLGAMEGESLGWTSLLNSSFFIVGFCFALLFYFHYRNYKTKEPFFDFSLFRNSNFLIGNLHAFIVQFLLMNTVFWTIFLQNAMELSPTTAGFWVFLSTAPTIIAAPLAGYLLDKYGVKLPTTIGFVGHSITYFCLIIFSIYGYFPLMIVGFVVYGFSVSQILTPTASFVISSAPKEKRGLVAGVYSTMRFTGATMGLAILGSIHSGTMKSDMRSYINEKELHLSKTQKTEFVKIYLGGQKTSSTGLKTNLIKQDSKKAAFGALKAISIISFILSLSGLMLIYAEQVRKGKIKKVSI